MTGATRLAAEVFVRLDRHDARVLQRMVGSRSRAIGSFMRGVTRLGDPIQVVGITVLLLVLGSGALREAAAHAAFALAFSHLLVQILKRTIVRPRPNAPIDGFLIAPPDPFSFPSGHAAAALSVAASIAPALGVPLALAVVTLGLLVGVSRCWLGVHYPGDVLAGWLLALLGIGTASLI